MSLVVWTARVTYAGEDLVNVTREHAHNIGMIMGRPSPGSIFAPSWNILNRFHSALESADWERAYDRMQRYDHMLRAARDAYAKAYIEELRVSYKQQRSRWEKFLHTDQVTFACVCTQPDWCHRKLLAEVFVKLGASYAGERIGPQQKLPGIG